MSPNRTTPDLLQQRSNTLRLVREFFHQSGFIEVETPIRIPAPAQETYINSPPSGSAWLRASPELQMKQLLVAGATKIYQIGSCFRSNECGSRHNPEFTMLEWYRAHADYNDILADTQGLLLHVFNALYNSTTLNYQGKTIDMTTPWHSITVSQAYQRWAGWNPATHWDADRFDTDMVTLIEPNLPQDKPCILRDYPAPAASLARLKPSNPLVAERWELYVGGLELANAYSELCDHDIQLQRFKEAAAERQALGSQPYPLDQDFFDALKKGMPPSGGIALGIDRLIMLVCNSCDISTIRPFCQQPGALY